MLNNKKVLVRNLKVSIKEDDDFLQKKLAKSLNIKTNELNNIRIVKQSIDARKKNDISFVYSVVAEIDSKIKIRENNDIKLFEESIEEKLTPGKDKLSTRPVVVGTGPAGLFAALLLAKYGYKPIVIERGESVENRTLIVDKYWKKGILNTETNVQFGEGGAGTFSDGKLTTRINDRRCDTVIDEFYKAGATADITYKAKPHIGSDVLKKVVVNIRNKIIELGGEVRFNTKLTSLIMENEKVKGLIVNQEEKIDTEIVILATGHSARDTYKALFEQGIKFIQKPFSVGVRIEHPQILIDKAQYGDFAGHHNLGAAEYQLFHKTGERTTYSFCMCPGGLVVASASEEGMIVTNGMSEYSRSEENANSALVVSVFPKDFGSSHPLAGIDFQRGLEQKAFKIAGANNSAPIQRLEDFINDRNSSKLGNVKPSYTGETNFVNINDCLPKEITDSMKHSINYFDNKLKGFGMKDAILTGVETRTSSPVRIPRDDSFQAIGLNGLYPIGEGAGYAGGIVSAAVDGIKAAEEIIKKYSS